MLNPFVTNGYSGDEYFCDRVVETEDLRTLLRNENNIALVSPRRLGKTELINHVFDCDEFRNNYHCFLIDVYASKSLNDLVNLLGKAVLDTLRPKGRAVWEFAVEKSEQGGKKFDPDVLSILYDRFDGVTSYIHRVLNILFSKTGAGEKCVPDMIDDALDYICRSNKGNSFLRLLPRVRHPR